MEMLTKGWFAEQDPVIQTTIATLFTWGVTALGAALVFWVRKIKQGFMDGMMGFAAGVMIAASFWSLLLPAENMAEAAGQPAWIPLSVGFLSGGFFIWGLDKVLPHLHVGFPRTEAEGLPTKWHRSLLLVLAITLHNIPEGLAVGVAFGALATDLPSGGLEAAVALAIGIGIQNFPEGVSVSLPLRREGFSRWKSFFWGQLSGAVEPIAGIVGAIAIVQMQALLPYALSFAAGAMIFVVVEELIPESQLNKNTDTATVGALAGFTVMMILDVM